MLVYDVIWSGLMNFVGVVAGGVAAGHALIELPDLPSPPTGSPAVTIRVAPFAPVCLRNVPTRWFGIPTSSSPCIIGSPDAGAPAALSAAPADKRATPPGSIGLSALIWFFGVPLFHVVPQSPMPGPKSLGWSLL